jgi:hypothetical protein
MGTFFHTSTDGTRYRVNLLPLSAYEAEGGRYYDKDGEVDRSQFVAAVIEERDGDDYGPCYDLVNARKDLGIEPGDLWRDASTGWVLLRDWPTEATLEARMVETPA